MGFSGFWQLVKGEEGMTFKIEWRKREQMGNSVGMNRMKRMRRPQGEVMDG
jgi:hypothetical protein